MNNWLQTLNKKYPLPARGRDGLIFALLFGLFVAYFLWYFRPFGINSQSYTDPEILFFGVISFGVFFSGHNIFPALFPPLFVEQNWIVWKQILFYILLSFLIATFNGLYINYLFQLAFSWSNYLLIITQTFALGSIPITMYVLFNHNRSNQQMLANAADLNQQIETQQPTVLPKEFSIHTKNKSETLVINEATFLYAQASSNYLEIVAIEQKPTLYRLNLTALEKELTESNHIIRSDRSYLVNTKHVSKVTGNAQGLKLHFSDKEEVVPVSRKYIAAIKTQMNQ